MLRKPATSVHCKYHFAHPLFDHAVHFVQCHRSFSCPAVCVRLFKNGNFRPNTHSALALHICRNAYVPSSAGMPWQLQTHRNSFSYEFFFNSLYFQAHQSNPKKEQAFRTISLVVSILQSCPGTWLDLRLFLVPE